MNPVHSRLLGIGVGLLAASIGALYTVFARWGISHGMLAQDMTFLRFAVAGLLTLPFLAHSIWQQRATFFGKWRAWLAVSVLAGPLFALCMFSALQIAPASHAAVMPFAAMSIMGTFLAAYFFHERLSFRKLTGIAVVIFGLIILSGLQDASWNRQAWLGDLLFLVAGTLWAGFGIVMRKQQLNPLLATAVISFSALVTYVPLYLYFFGIQTILNTAPMVLWIEILIQGVIAGAGTLYTYSKLVALLGPSSAAIFPALAPGIAALIA